ncbi:hypothetical protein PG987_015876 [Apiospora arundinis]
MVADPQESDPSPIPSTLHPQVHHSNLGEGDDLQTTILATGITFITISLIVVIIRLGTRLKLSRTLHLDDCLCLMGEVVGVASWVVEYELTVKPGLAKHSWDVDTSTLKTSELKAMVSLLILMPIANGLAKAAILRFFFQLFGTLRWVRLVCYSLFATTVILYAGYEIAILAICIPTSGESWDATVLLRINKVLEPTVTLGVYNVIIDVAMFVLPLLVVARLHMQPERKRGVAFVFFLGLLVVVTSVVGLVYRIIIAMPSTVDKLWNETNVSITGYAEMFGTVIVSCAPALYTFWTKIVSKSRLYSRLRGSGPDKAGGIALEPW